MKNITLKGTKTGILLVIKENIDFDTIKNETKILLEENASFLKTPNINVSYKGVKLSFDQEMELFNIIKTSVDADVKFSHQQKLPLESILHSLNTNERICTFRNTTVRGGEEVFSRGDIVILGDVNANAIVRANGNIIVIGALRGVAHAGFDGDEKAFIFASQMQATQIRIAQNYSYSPKKDEDYSQGIARAEKDEIILQILEKNFAKV